MLVIGLTAFVESFVFLSLLFPGTAILIAAGTLVSEGILSPVPTVVAGIAGAVLGDSVSFWLGQKFGPLLPKIWPLIRLGPADDMQFAVEKMRGCRITPLRGNV